MWVRIEDIKVKSGRRPIDADSVQSMVGSMLEVGQLQPIIISKDYQLIAGLHRLEAVKIMGWETIDCTISDMSEEQAELAEIDENFVRNDLTLVQRGLILQQRKEIYERLHPEVRHGGDRKSEKIKMQKLHLDSAQPFVDDAAEKCGQSKRSISLLLWITKKIAPEALEILKDVRISQTNLRTLSRLPAEQQIEIAKQLAAGELKAVEEWSSQSDRDASQDEKGEAQAQAVTTKKHSKSETKESQESVSIPQRNEKAQKSADMPDSTIYEQDLNGQETSNAKKPCLTTKQIIEDIKRTDKTGLSTPEEFVGAIARFAEKFHQEIEWYFGAYYEDAYHKLSGEQLDFLQSKMDSISSRARQLYKYIERMATNEL